MKIIPKPITDQKAKSIFEICVGGYVQEKKRQELLKYSSEVERVSDEYEQYIPNDFENFNHPVFSSADKKRLESIYSYQFREKIGKTFYNQIMRNAKHLCPYCGEGRPTNLDHFLPQSKYPLLVVTPVNLVPSCKDCNMEKNAVIPTSNEDIPLHPYYDDINIKWLDATIKFDKDESFTIDFFNVVNITTNRILSKRIDAHMKSHALKECFETHSTSEINSIKYKHADLAKLNRSELINDLQDRIWSAERYDINSWKSAMYRALLNQVDEYIGWLMMLK